jgi:hypothetical protein
VKKALVQIEFNRKPPVDHTDEPADRDAEEDV